MDTQTAPAWFMNLPPEDWQIQRGVWRDDGTGMVHYRYALLCRGEEILAWVGEVDHRWVGVAGLHAGEAITKQAEQLLQNGLAPAVIAMVEKLKELGAWGEQELAENCWMLDCPCGDLHTLIMDDMVIVNWDDLMAEECAKAREAIPAFQHWITEWRANWREIPTRAEFQALLSGR